MQKTEVIKALIKIYGTQKNLAKEHGITENTVYFWKSGKVVPSTEKLQEIALKKGYELSNEFSLIEKV